jgi:hypothetical protein
VSLRLDLSEPRAKLQRAEEHLTNLQAKLPLIRGREPLSLRVTEIDSSTGWCEVFGHWNHIKEPALTVIAGDYIHNLRSALDYLVTVLVDASEATLVTRHQFPIFTSADDYTSKVGTSTEANAKGPLQGITHGLELIESVQPYKLNHPERHPLAHIQRFSNTDKHRQTLVLSERMEKPSLTVSFLNGPDPVEQWIMPEWGLAVDDDTKIAAFRFAEPFVTKTTVEPGELQPLFGAPAFPPRYPLGFLGGMDVIESLYDMTDEVLTRAEQL